jgi:hypothetical protein
VTVKRLNPEGTLRKKISLAVTMLFSVAVGLLYIGCSHSGASDSGQIADDFKPDISAPKLKEKLGDDDGYSLAVLYGSDVHGSLETCG